MDNGYPLEKTPNIGAKGLAILSLHFTAMNACLITRMYVLIFLILHDIVSSRELVAYVFAGSARSFVMPAIQKMLNKNLIQVQISRDRINLL